MRSIYPATKRALDVVASAAGLVVLAPVLGLAAIAVRASSPGPVLFRQERMGRGGVPFQLLKFRSMTVSPAGSGPLVTVSGDRRVTPVGRFLRRTKIDELPQLVNVLRGDMSLVGPRPIVTEEAAMYGQALAAYLRSRPGVTGAWQVKGRNNASYASRVAMDRNYVEHWSLWRDLVIIVKTIPALLTTRGSY